MPKFRLWTPCEHVQVASGADGVSSCLSVHSARAQQTCLDITQLTWPIILSHVPNQIGRVGGIFTCSFLGQLQPKSDWKRGPRSKAEKASTAKEQLKNPRTANAMSNLIGATRLEGLLFDDVALSQRGNPSKDRDTEMTKTCAIDRGPLTPPERNPKEHGQKWWTSKDKLRFWLDKLIKIALKEDGGLVNIVKQTLIAKLCSNLLETGFQIMQPCQLTRCRSLLHGDDFLLLLHVFDVSYKCANIYSYYTKYIVTTCIPNVPIYIVTIIYLCLTINLGFSLPREIGTKQCTI